MPRGSGLYTNIETEFIRGHRWISLPPEVRCLYLAIWCYALDQKRQIIERPPSDYLRSMAGLPHKPIDYYLQILHEKRLIILLTESKAEAKRTQSDNEAEAKRRQSAHKADPNLKKAVLMFIPGLSKKNSKIKFKDELEIPQGLLGMPTSLPFPSLPFPKPPNPLVRGKSADTDGLPQGDFPTMEEADAQAHIVAEEYVKGIGKSDNRKKGEGHISKRIRGKKVGSGRAEVFAFKDLLAWTRNLIADFDARCLVDGEKTARQFTPILSNLFGQDLRILEYRDGPKLSMDQAKAQADEKAGKERNARLAGYGKAIMAKHLDIQQALSSMPDLAQKAPWWTGPVGFDDATARVAMAFPWDEHLEDSEQRLRGALWAWMRENIKDEG